MTVQKTFSTVGLILAASLVACGPVRVRPAPVPTAMPVAPAVASCPANPLERQPIDLRDVQWLGRAANHTWVLGKSGGHRVLLRLVSGKVENVVLPEAFDTGFVSAHAREHFIWVLRTGSDKPISDPAWVLVDVRDPKEPRIGRIELLEKAAFGRAKPICIMVGPCVVFPGVAG
ncbi:MAG: hypothetical protein IPM54_31705 [Polyangiaceae bacterium]|nr:hypothetical protein [Polyangiaceae bacterium]